MSGISSMLQAEWLSTIMECTPSEIYVIDSDTLELLRVSPAASANLLYTAQELAGMSITSIAPAINEQRLRQLAGPLYCGAASRVMLNSLHRRKDGSMYPVQLNLYREVSGTRTLFIAISGPDHTAAPVDASIDGSPAQAVVSRMPVLIYNFQLKSDGSTAFPYLNEGCENLLGVSPDQLHADADVFLSLLLAPDRPSYIRSMKASAKSLSVWNWEGRIWIEDWKDIKWINLRATPSSLPDGSILWEGIMTNITVSKSEELKLKRSRAQLAELSAHIESVKEQERTRIAREIHDDMGGNLTAIKMALALLVRRLPAKDNALLEKASYVDTLIDRTIEAVHRIAGDLRPGILDFGLVASITWQAKEFEKQTGIPCNFDSDKEDVETSPEHATALFRIVQEALANISKHAMASQVNIELRCTLDSLCLTITDNGCGIAASDRLKPKSFGIRGMAERARALGGQLSIQANSGRGTRLGIRIPLQTFGE